MRCQQTCRLLCLCACDAQSAHSITNIDERVPELPVRTGMQAAQWLRHCRTASC